jgi:endonuclease/exonuclease/phosphatase family metal-dependent hydrolase
MKAKRSSRSTSSVTLKVLSFNVRCMTADDGLKGWIYRRDSAAKLIASTGCDIAGLQEAYREQNDDLLTRLPDYRMLGVGRDDGKVEGEYSTILYRPDRLEVKDSGTFWFSPTPHAPGSLGWGARLPRICTRGHFSRDGIEFSLYNLHLDHESQEARENSVALLLERIDRARPSVVTGDFNAGETNGAVHAMTEAGYRDAWRSTHLDAPEPGTYHGFNDHPNPGKIDYIWVSENIQVVSSEILTDKVAGRYPSDHFAIRAEFQMD